MHNFKFDKKRGANPLLAIDCFIKGLKLLGRKELRPFIIIPVLVNLFLYSIMLALAYYFIAGLIEQFIPAWLSWLNWILWPLFFISFFSIGFFTFTLLANLFAAPFYGKLSARTFSLLYDQPFQTEEQPVTKVVWAEFIRLLYLGSRGLPLLILFIIPGINLVAPFVWALFSAWGMVLEYMAYPLENEGLLFIEQRQLIKTARIGALTFGGITLFGLAIPILNILIPPAAVIGAAVYTDKLQKNNKN